MYKLVMFTWIHEHYRNPISSLPSLTRSIPRVHCTVRGLENLKYYFLKSWGKCCWIRLMLCGVFSLPFWFSAGQFPAQITLCCCTLEVFSTFSTRAASSPYLQISTLLTNHCGRDSCMQIEEVQASTHTLTYTHTRREQINYTPVLTQMPHMWIQFLPAHHICIFSHHCIIPSADEIAHTLLYTHPYTHIPLSSFRVIILDASQTEWLV